jgi:L-erythro-3,5-diaminohexanoate dehydrogenase
MLTPDALGAHRVIDPSGALPQAAARLDAKSPPGPTEMAVEVELLSLDSTSHRQVSEECGRDPDRMADRIAQIVQTAGKLHNPVTGSGGILVGRAVFVGEDFPAGDIRIADRVVTLGSLTMTPLRLDEVGPVDPGSPHIPARGQAIVAQTAPWTRPPEDLPFRLAVACLDVYGAAPKVRSLAPRGGHVLVMGAGRAGLISLAAARAGVGQKGLVTSLDHSPQAVALAEEAQLCDVGVVADARDAVATLRALEARGVPSADLTVSVVNAPDCEVSAILATRHSGDVLFFSMSTSFTRATLGAESFGSTARMLLGSGYDEDRGALTLELVRTHPRLFDALCVLEHIDPSDSPPLS